jgi:hypothetical protein
MVGQKVGIGKGEKYFCPALSNDIASGLLLGMIGTKFKMKDS